MCIASRRDSSFLFYFILITLSEPVGKVNVCRVLKRGVNVQCSNERDSSFVFNFILMCAEY